MRYFEINESRWNQLRLAQEALSEILNSLVEIEELEPEVDYGVQDFVPDSALSSIG